MYFPGYLVALALVVSYSAAMADWPQFRGPEGQGHAADKKAPLKWDATNNVVWRQAIPGRGWSSPAISKGTIFLTTSETSTNSGGLSLRALAVDEASGKILWNKECFVTEPGRMHNKNSHASPTAVVDGDRVFVHFGHQGTASLDRKGTILWKNTGLAYEPVHGNGGSPALVDDILVFSCDGGSDPFVVALGQNDGKVRWKVKRETSAKKKFSFSTPLVITVNGKKQIISPGSGAVCAYDPANGNELWRVRYGEGYSVIPRPVFANGLIFIGTGYDRPTIVAIKPDGKGDVTDTHVVWTLAKGAPNTPSLLVVGDELYAVSDGGIGSCIDAKTGTVHWQERLGGNYSSSPHASISRTRRGTVWSSSPEKRW